MRKFAAEKGRCSCPEFDFAKCPRISGELAFNFFITALVLVGFTGSTFYQVRRQ